MQPSESAAGSRPAMGGGPPSGGRSKLPDRRLRLWLAMGAGILALLCLGGVGVFVSLYDEATEIKRTAPDAVADSFLRAYLVNRDDQEASLYMCKSGGDFAAISSLRNQFIDREEKFDVKVVVSWSSLTVTGSGEGPRTVATELTIAGAADGATQSRRQEAWTLRLVDQDGWRVCGAHKVS